MRRQARSSRIRRPLHLSELEARQMLDASSILWPESPYLSLSFAPDGTDIGGAPNQLAETFGSLGPPDEWQDQILLAFHTWSQHTNSDIGLVDDSGDDFGTPGARLQDPRFGDIRIGARPLAADVMAISISQDSLVSGTWAGDVIFNSEADFRNLDELFSVALHEAGHVFGLEHTDESDSPMRIHGVSEFTSPTASDLAMLQDLYGSRLLDSAEWESDSGRNDSREQATELEGGEAISEVNGSAPAIVFADIGKGDTDVYRVEVPDDYRGDMTVRLVTKGISLLSPRMSVTDANGNVLHQLDGGRSVWNGDQANSIAVRPDSELFIEVNAGSNTSFDVGGYTLVVRFDEVNVIDQTTEDEVVFSNLRRLMIDDFDDFFDQDEETYFHEDGHSDDDLDSAFELAELAGYGRMQKYEFVGSLTGNMDRDYFKIKSPPDLASDVATISVRSLDAGKLIPLVQLFDDQHQAVASRILVNGNGDYIVQAAGIQPDREYFVEIQAADATDGFATGNYQLTALFGGRTVPVAEFSAGSLFDSAESTSLHVATTQLFHFGLSVDDTTAASREGALIRIVNSEGKVLTQVAAATGQTRTAGNVLLSPGQYRIQTIPLRSEVNQNPTALKYLVRGSVVSDPFGVDPLEPSSTEYQCPDLNGVFCYPGGIQSPDPYIFDDFLNQFPDAGVIDVSNWDQFILGEWWNWYWQETGLHNSEPLGFSDTYDAQQGLPLEVSSFQGVLQNDIDPNADSLSAVLVNAPSAGQLSLQASGAFQYVSTNRFEGTDSFTYRVSDGDSLSAEVTVTIQVGANPAALGDFDQDGQFGQADIQRMRQAIEAGWIGAFDLNHDSVTDAHDWQILIHDVIGTSFGDANLDGRFDSQDLIAVFQSGRFEVSNTVSSPVEWNAGDWNGDGSFDTADLVLAFQDGAYDVNGATTAQESNSVFAEIAAGMTSRRQQGKQVQRRF